jgi:hypothetical protein
MTDTTARIHAACGNPMTPSQFGPHNETRHYRLQPIWLCDPCRAWEPREGWDAPLPAGWDGTAWTGQSR